MHLHRSVRFQLARWQCVHHARRWQLVKGKRHREERRFLVGRRSRMGGLAEQVVHLEVKTVSDCGQELCESLTILEYGENRRRNDRMPGCHQCIMSSLLICGIR